MSLLRDFRPDLSDAERREMAWKLAAGFAQLVIDDDFEQLDPIEQSTEIERLVPDEPLEPIASDRVSWVAFHLVDQRGRPLPYFRARVQDPSGAEHTATLDQNATVRVSALTDDGSCSLTLEVDPQRAS